MKKGPLFEKMIVEDLRRTFGDSIERRVMGGKNDRGDVAGVFWRGREFVIEAKNVTQLRPKKWFDELEAECGNADTDHCSGHADTGVHQLGWLGCHRDPEPVCHHHHTACGDRAGSHPAPDRNAGSFAHRVQPEKGFHRLCRQNTAAPPERSGLLQRLH